jgi:hypothetical protein
MFWANESVVEYTVKMLLRVLYSWKRRRVVRQDIGDSEENITFIFRIED